jgi:hypothetical protein
LVKTPEGRSAKDLVLDFGIPEADLRETLRKLDDAGLAQRVKGVWKAVPIHTAEVDPASEPDTSEASTADA